MWLSNLCRTGWSLASVLSDAKSEEQCPKQCKRPLIIQEEIAQQLLPSARSKTLSRITRGKVADHLAPEFQQQPWKLMSKRQRARRLTRKLVGAPGTSR